MKLTFKTKFSDNKAFLREIRRKFAYESLLYSLGCAPSYTMTVLDEPRQVLVGTELQWEYNLKIVAKHIRVFGITIKTIKYE